MNLRRGVLRLWLVLSLCWIVGVGVFAWGYEQTMASRDQALRACFEARKAEGTDMFSCFPDETPYDFARPLMHFRAVYRAQELRTPQTISCCCRH